MITITEIKAGVFIILLGLGISFINTWAESKINEMFPGASYLIIGVLILAAVFVFIKYSPFKI